MTRQQRKDRIRLTVREFDDVRQIACEQMEVAYRCRRISSATTRDQYLADVMSLGRLPVSWEIEEGGSPLAGMLPDRPVFEGQTRASGKPLYPARG